MDNSPMLDVLTLSAEIRNEYKSLTFDLTDNSSVPGFADPDNPAPGVYDKEAAAEYVFKSVIKADAVKDYLDNTVHGSHVTYTTNPTSGLQAYLTKNDVSVSSLSEKTRLIVSFGNVTVDRDFTGLIIAKGKITVTGGAGNIKLGGTELYDVLQANSELWVDDGSGDNHKMIDWFVNGGSMANGAQAPNVDDVGNRMLDYSELVRYMNWIKK
ncbi:MAG: hypothetical protein K2M22_00565 [Lachnospiraceae bacterium]|nr:hypothetical protein [Lachnospiraceae bacterium]